MQIKTTKRLFNNKYQYKIVLVCAGASYFKNKDFSHSIGLISKLNIDESKITARYGYKRNSIKDPSDRDYALSLLNIIKDLTDYEIRIENPWISFYTNSREDVDKLCSVSIDQVKYISVPPSSGIIAENTVLLPKIDFEYRVTLGKTTQEHSAFIEWAKSNKKLKLTKSCERDLTRSNSWGGTYFYCTGDNNLLMAKMHLGGSINKVERVVKA